LTEPLPNLRAAVAAKKAIMIVALGSSSTWGTGSSSREHTYPARLQRELKKAWPAAEVGVFNAGVGGQLARDMTARIERDVAKHKPQLVLWQTGVNDAIRGVPVAEFRAELKLGIARLRAIGADVVLIDQQFYPKFHKVKNAAEYLAAVRDAGEASDAPVVQRFRIMQHLISSAQFTPETLLSADQFHMNDKSYDCIGHLLAKSLQAAAAPVAVIEAAGGAHGRM
jgi:acyl-CoA thioesterase-1